MHFYTDVRLTLHVINSILQPIPSCILQWCENLQIFSFSCGTYRVKRRNRTINMSLFLVFLSLRLSWRCWAKVKSRCPFHLSRQSNPGSSLCSTSWRIRRWTAAVREPPWTAIRALMETRSNSPLFQPQPKSEWSLPSLCARCLPCATWLCCGQPAKAESASLTSGSL